MERLRGPKGCPWDQAQTHQSLRRYCIEEAHEVVEAIDGGDDAELCAELGDLLLQVVFHAQLAKERGAFGFSDIVGSICDKMERRHPHVFDPEFQGQGGAPADWEALKAKESKVPKDRRSVLDGVPRAMPALLRAQRLADKAATVGCDWPDDAGPRAKISEEIEELDQALSQGDPSAIAHEMGDLLLATMNLARQLGQDAEFVTQEAADRFQQRFRAMETRAIKENRPLKDRTLAEQEALWQEVKVELEAQDQAPRDQGDGVGEPPQAGSVSQSES